MIAMDERAVLAVLAAMLLASGCTTEEQGGSASGMEDCLGMDDGYDRDVCVRRRAQDSNNSALCGVINDLNQRDHCYSNIAKATGKWTLCLEEYVTLQRLRDKDGLYWKVAGFDLGCHETRYVLLLSCCGSYCEDR